MAELGFRQVFAKDFRCRTPANPDHPHDAADAAAYIGELVDTWNGAHDGLVRLGVAIESNAHWLAAGMSSDELVEAGYRLARERGLAITTMLPAARCRWKPGICTRCARPAEQTCAIWCKWGVLDEFCC